MRRISTRLATMEGRTRGTGCVVCGGGQPVVLRFLTHAEAANPAARAAVVTHPHPAECGACGRRVIVREYVGDPTPGHERDRDGGGL